MAAPPGIRAWHVHGYGFYDPLYYGDEIDVVVDSEYRLLTSPTIAARLCRP